jgi:ribosome-associated translation inhibitor RaiA
MMKIQYQVLGMNSHAASHRPMDGHLRHLNDLIPINSATVRLEHHRETTPAFCALVHLAVPGTDIHAAARDHTLQAVILKVVRRLEEQIEGRKNRQQRRLKRREHCRGVASQWNCKG